MQFFGDFVQSQDGVAYMAHIGGLVAGAVLFPLMRHRSVRLFECIRAGTGPWGQICLRVRRSINVDRPMPPPLASRLS